MTLIAALSPVSVLTDVPTATSGGGEAFAPVLASLLAPAPPAMDAVSGTAMPLAGQAVPLPGEPLPADGATSVEPWPAEEVPVATAPAITAPPLARVPAALTLPAAASVSTERMPVMPDNASRPVRFAHPVIRVDAAVEQGGNQPVASRERGVLLVVEQDSTRPAIGEPSPPTPSPASEVALLVSPEQVAAEALPQPAAIIAPSSPAAMGGMPARSSTTPPKLAPAPSPLPVVAHPAAVVGRAPAAARATLAASTSPLAFGDTAPRSTTVDSDQARAVVRTRPAASPSDNPAGSRESPGGGAPIADATFALRRPTAMPTPDADRAAPPTFRPASSPPFARQSVASRLASASLAPAGATALPTVPSNAPERTQSAAPASAEPAVPTDLSLMDIPAESVPATLPALPYTSAAVAPDQPVVAQTVVPAPIARGHDASVKPSGVAAPVAPTSIGAPPVPVGTLLPQTPVVLTMPPPPEAVPMRPAGRTEATAAAVPAPQQAQVALAPPAAVIRPALQAFGAALHRAVVAERRPATISIDPGPAPFAPVAAASPAPAPASLDMTQPRWPDAMMARIEQVREAQNAADTRIRLHPDALGHIDVALRRDGEAVQVHFTAAEPATQRLLADAQPRLAELAEAKGLKLAGSGVDAGAGNPGQDRRQPAAPQAPLPARPARARDTATSDIDTRLA